MSIEAIDLRNRSELLATDAEKTHARYLEFLKVNGWSSEYKSVDALLKHLSRKSGSEASRRTYLQRLYPFCLYVRKDPDELVRLLKGDIEGLVQDYADGFNNDRYSRRYANNILGILKTFFKINGFKNANALEVEGYYTPSRYRKVREYIPYKHEIYLMADSAHSLRDRAIVLFFCSGGLRTSTLGALLYRDIKDELSKGIDNILVPIYPEMKLIDHNACKGNIPYYTFVCDEATQAIRLYFEERKERYGEILGDEPLFASEYNQISKRERRNKPMTSRQVQIVIKSLAKAARLPDWQHVTPYCLRKAFESVLRSELIDGGKLDPKDQEFLMGHILPGSQEAYYDKTKIEKLRSEYSRLNFGRVVVENKFKVLRSAVAKAFEGTGFDPNEVMEEYVKMKGQMSAR